MGANALRARSLRLGAGVAEVDDGEGAAGVVEVGAAGNEEAEGFVEAKCVGVLFVDVDGERALEHAGVLDEAATTATAEVVRVEEEGFEVVVVEAHEAEGLV